MKHENWNWSAVVLAVFLLCCFVGQCAGESIRRNEAMQRDCQQDGRLWLDNRCVP